MLPSELAEYEQLDAWDFILDGWEAGYDLSTVDPTDPDVVLEVVLVE